MNYGSVKLYWIQVNSEYKKYDFKQTDFEC